MKTVKYFLILIITSIGLFIMSTKVDAAVSYTRTIPSNDGSIVINLSGLELQTEKAYEYGLATQGSVPSKWFDVTEKTTSTLKVNLGSGTTGIVEVLRVADVGTLFVREKNNESGTYVAKLDVNLKLPLLQATSYTAYDKGSYNVHDVYDSIGGYDLLGTKKTYYKFQIVKDKTFIEQFLKVKNNGDDISTLENYLPNHPTTGWNVQDTSSTFGENSHKEPGLYFLWLRLTGDGCKDIYGCIIHDGIPEATKVEQYIEGLDVDVPTVESIKVITPLSGTYKTGQTVKIGVYFSETITGTSVPTLKIKFGESPVRSVTNGIIKTSGTAHFIEYSYNIQATDVGQLATVSLEGGTIKDETGNDAKLSCPSITGTNYIRANVDGIDNNNTGNQDTNSGNNSGQSSGGSNNNSSNNGSNSSTNNGGNSGSTNNGSNSGTSNSGNNAGTTSGKDNTMAQGTIPQTGESLAIFVVIAIIAVIGIVAMKKYRKNMDIK